MMIAALWPRSVMLSMVFSFAHNAHHAMTAGGIVCWIGEYNRIKMEAHRMDLVLA